MGSYQVVATNYAEASENKMHSDDVARRYGFQGALVPGVAVYGYLTHPLVEELGERWLQHSTSHVRFHKPAYQGDVLTVTLEGTAPTLVATCVNASGVVLATLETDTGALPDAADQAPLARAPKAAGRPDIVWDNVTEGEPFAPWHWQITEDGNAAYAEQIDDQLAVYRTAAHPHWLLGIANSALTREFVMPAWIHVGSEIRFRELLRVGDTVEVRTLPLEKWERKGHQFLKLYLAYHRDGTLTTEIFHTVIFRVAS